MKKHAALISALALAALLVPGASHAGPNLAPNPGFERGAAEADGNQICEIVSGTYNQAVLPAGWAFEGNAFFDYAPKNAPERVRNGCRALAISAPASTNEAYTVEGNTVENPINPAREAARPAYMITPVWRTLQPVPVSGGTYRLSAYTSQGGDNITYGEGAVLWIRWVDANGVPIKVDKVAEKLFGPGHPNWNADFWYLIGGNVSAPAAAKGAILMLGHTDDLWTAHLRFDDVCFGRPADCP